MSFEFILRIVGMLVLAVAGGYWGFDLGKLNPDQALRTTLTFSLVGALAGLILTPYITTRPARALRSTLGRLSAESLFAGMTGLVVGLLIAALLAFPLSLLAGLSFAGSGTMKFSIVYIMMFVLGTLLIVPEKMIRYIPRSST